MRAVETYFSAWLFIWVLIITRTTDHWTLSNIAEKHKKISRRGFAIRLNVRHQRLFTKVAGHQSSFSGLIKNSRASINFIASGPNVCHRQRVEAISLTISPRHSTTIHVWLGLHPGSWTLQTTTTDCRPFSGSLLIYLDFHQTHP